MIRLEHVTKKFGDRTVLRDVSMTVPTGSVTVILGPSGSGKTTFLRTINFLGQADGGTLRLDEDKPVDLAHASQKEILQVRRNTAMVFQLYNLFSHMTVLENVMEGLVTVQKKSRQEARERALSCLKEVDMDQFRDYYPIQLSGGQQQRVALARALIAQPGLLLLDEPLSNLDAKLRESMRFEISSLQKRLGITVIYVTHDQSEAMTMSDRIVVMNAGVVQQVGRPYDVYTHPVNKMVADFIGLVNFLPAEVRGDRVFVQGTQVSFPNKENLAQGPAVIGVRPENLTLSKTGGMLQGTVKHRFYMGDAVDYRIQVGGQVLRVMTHGSSYHQWADGEPIYLDLADVILLDNEKSNYVIT